MSEIVEIQKAEQGDRDGICRVHRTSIMILCGAHYTPQEIEAWVGPKQPSDYDAAIQDEMVFVARTEGRVVGFAQMTRDDATIVGLYVHPKHARHGVGTKLLACLEHEARALRLPTVTVDATLNSVAFYLLRGYSFRGEGTQSVGGGMTIPCVRMQKLL